MLADTQTGQEDHTKTVKGLPLGNLLVGAGAMGVTGRGIRGYEPDGLKASTLLANGRGSRHVSDIEQFLIPRTEITWDQITVPST